MTAGSAIARICASQRRQRDKITTARSEDNRCQYGQARASVIKCALGVSGSGLVSRNESLRQDDRLAR
jgi:hypothetical protein